MIDDNSGLPYRRSIRLKEYDYSQSGAYFVTICTLDFRYLFGDVVDYAMRLNEFGQATADCWQSIPAHVPGVDTDAFVVMPNHFHGILVIGDPDSDPFRIAPHDNTIRRFGKPLARSLSTMIGSFKSAATRRINLIRGTPASDIWHRNYYEHIIRNEHDLTEIRDYIANNPAKWAEDRYYVRTPR